MPPITLPFIKMQALGNDFVLIKENDVPTPLTSAQVRHIANRHEGVGCDQIILLKDPSTYDATISFYNADGSKAFACGNGTRCVAKYLKKDSGFIETPSFISHFQKEGPDITISLREPTFLPPHPQGHHCIDVGNPHLVIFVDRLESMSLVTLGPLFQPLEGINIEIAQIITSSTIKVKVWERGVGITQACGSGACAVGILALKLGLIKKPPVFIEMEGGQLRVDWALGQPPLLTGPADICFEGIVELP